MIMFEVLNETKPVSGFYRNRKYLANLHLPPKIAHQNIAKIVSQNTSNFNIKIFKDLLFKNSTTSKLHFSINYLRRK